MFGSRKHVGRPETPASLPAVPAASRCCCSPPAAHRYRYYRRPGGLGREGGRSDSLLLLRAAACNFYTYDLPFIRAPRLYGASRGAARRR